MNEKYPTNSSDSRNLRQPSISRRRVLATITATAGFGSSNVVASPNRGNASVEIVTARTGNGEQAPYETAKVSKKWLQYEKRVTNQVEALKRQYSNKDWVGSISIGPSKKSVAGAPASVLQIEIKEKGKRKNVPDKLDKIPVEKIAPGKDTLFTGENILTGDVGTLDHGSCHYMGSFSNVTGGVVVGLGSSTSTTGTAGYMVAKNGNKYLLSANHIWGSCEDTDGDRVDQGRQYLGRIAGHHQSHDWALIEDRSSEKRLSPEIRIYHRPNRFKKVASYATRDGMRYYKRTEKEVYKQGIATGFERGKITNLSYDFDEGCASYNNGIIIFCKIGGGDSGGPMFTYGKKGNAIMLGHTVHKRDPGLDNPFIGNDCFGNKMEPRSGGWPTWRMLNKDYGGQYTLVTSPGV